MRRYLWQIIAIVVFIMLLFGGTIVRLYTDWIWFKDVGYVSIFGRILAARLALFFFTAAAFFAVIYLNLRIARKIAPLPTERLYYADEFRQKLVEYAERGLGLMLALVALVVAILAGLAAIGRWDEALRFIYSVPFGYKDPIFHRDLGFYVFKLPFLRYMYGQLFLALFISLAAVVALYYLGQAIEFLANIPRFAPRVKAHVFTLLAIMFLLRAFGYWLDRFGLLTKESGVIPGPAYADIYGRLPALNILIVVCVLAALLSVLNIWRRGIWLALGSLVGIIVVCISVGSMYPAILQRFVVKPNEFTKETRFISYGIDLTRKAYGLSDIVRRTYQLADSLTTQDIARNQPTIQNVRLWDYQPLQRTYKQVQELQQYYTFSDVDIDRYTINGQYRQVMLSAREMEQKGLSSRAQNWVNNHLVYTHGYGLVMSPVNEVGPQGLPRFLIEDIPTVSSADLTVTVPQVYFGEVANPYALVNTNQKEFDYPSGEADVFTKYRSDRGVRISNPFIKSMFAARFGDITLMITPNITANSRLLFRRTVQERVKTIFPFLEFDNDPYLVLSGGRMYWVQDAYTVSDRVPYSQMINMQFNYSDGSTDFNYIRNSVKITLDAYTGDVRAYVFDERDPIIRAYGRAFPGVFRPSSRMPADLQRHVRYPEDLFSVQTVVYNTYHMTNPREFFTRSDLWEIPESQRSGVDGDAAQGSQPMEPYYSVMRLPNAKKEEFILIRPFNRANRKNMVAWACAKCDPQDYGRLVVFEFEKGQLVYGPSQIEARANQEPEISRQLTLWGQVGSTVTWGNLLAIPVENSLLYVQPLYLESAATGTAIPEFVRVITAVGDQIAMEETLGAAIAKVTGGPAPRAPAAARPTARPAPPPAAPAAGSQELINQAADQFQRAQEELRRLEKTLNELKRQSR